VADDIFQHIDVREEGKENEYSLGRSLWIGTEEFEDLDEIIARYINPMALAARELIQYKYYKPNTTEENGNERDFMEQVLRDEKTKDPKKIHYFFTASRSMPGKFLLSYLPKTKVRHEYVTVMPEGYRFRGQIFDSVNSLLRWFKEHWLDPTASPATGSSASNSTPLHSMRPPPTISSSSLTSLGSQAPYSITGSVGGGTPRSGISSSGGGGGGSSSAYSVSHSIVGYNSSSIGSGAAAAAAASHYGSSSTPSFGAIINTPYTPSGQTPFMTPYTPHASQTPRYGHNVPSPSSQSSSSQRHHYSSSSGTGSTPRYYDMGGGGGGGGSNAYNMGGGNMPPHHQQRAKENLDWQLANDAWARRRPPPQQQQQSHHGQQQHHHPQQQQQMGMGMNMGMGMGMGLGPGGGGYGSTPGNEYSSSGGGGGGGHSRGMGMGMNQGHGPGASMSSKSSVRSTPRTNTSPHSMNLGDATPLYDEN